MAQDGNILRHYLLSYLCYFSVLLFLLCIANGLHSRALLRSPFSQSVSVSLSSCRIKHSNDIVDAETI